MAGDDFYFDSKYVNQLTKDQIDHNLNFVSKCLYFEIDKSKIRLHDLQHLTGDKENIKVLVTNQENNIVSGFIEFMFDSKKSQEAPLVLGQICENAKKFNPAEIKILPYRARKVFKAKSVLPK